MNTLQSTISKKLSIHRDTESADEAVGKFLKPMSKADFMKDIE